MIQSIYSAGVEVVLDDFSAACTAYKVEAAVLSPNTYQGGGALLPTYTDTKEGLYSLSIDLLIETPDVQAARSLALELKQRLLKCNVIFEDDRQKEYDCILHSYTLTDLLPGMILLNCVFDAVIWGPEVCVVLSENLQNIAIDGPQKTYLTISVEALQDLTEYAVCGMIIYSLPQGKTLVVDGARRTVEIDSVNAFDTVSIIDFPAAQGEFTAVADDLSRATVTISYRGRW